MNTRLALAVIPATLALLLTGCSPDATMTKPAAPASAMEKPGMAESTSAMEKTPDAMPSDAMTEDAMGKAGSYVALADYQARMDSFAGTRVVYFFHAGWCPDCKAADLALSASGAKLPAGVTIVKVDYDTETELKRTYGVTMQHTYVEVDAAGKAVNTWTAKNITTVLDQLAG